MYSIHSNHIHCPNFFIGNRANVLLVIVLLYSYCLPHRIRKNFISRCRLQIY